MIPSKILPLDNQLAALIEGGWYGEAVALARAAERDGHLSSDVVNNIAGALAQAPHSAFPQDQLYGLTSAGGNAVISSLLFRELNTFDEMKAAFKQAVIKVEIETSTLCNRHCAYCPNDELDVAHRRTTNEFLDFDLFMRVLTDLREIGYDREVGLVGLNEFFLSEENFRYLAEVKRFIPQCRLVLYSNGDCITREYLEQAARMGADILVVSFHMQYSKPWNTDDILDRAWKFAKRTGLDLSLMQYQKSGELFFNTSIGRLAIQCGLRNYAECGHNWGGAVQSGRGDADGEIPCVYGIEQFVMCRTGDLNVCCNVAREPTPFNIECGARLCNLNDYPSVFHAFASPAYRNMRRRAFSLHDLPELCRNCSNRNSPVLANDRDVAALVEANHPLPSDAAR